MPTNEIAPRTGIRLDQLQLLTREGGFLLLGTTAFTLHYWLCYLFEALVVGLAQPAG